jgi:hypothetical protein
MANDFYTQIAEMFEASLEPNEAKPVTETVTKPIETEKDFYDLVKEMFNEI